MARSRHARVLLLSCALLLASAPPAVANAPDRLSYVYTAASCDEIEAPGGTLSFEFDQYDGETYFFIEFWAAGTGGSDGPALVSTFEPAEVTATAESIRGTVPMERLDGERAGNATVAITLAAIGEPYPIRERTRFGNLSDRYTGTGQALAVGGTVRMPTGERFTLAGCEGERVSISAFTTWPNAYADVINETMLDCEFESSDTYAFVLIGEDTAIFFLASSSGQTMQGFMGEGDELLISREEIRATVQMYDFETQAQLGQVVLRATIAESGEPLRYDLRSRTSAISVVEQPLAVRGGVRFPGAVSFGLRDCVAARVRLQALLTSPARSLPSGPPPTNDTPAGAVLLKAGDQLRNVPNGTAARLPEAGCRVPSWFGEYPEPVPIRRTVWYRIRGTGAPITVDTAGSDFDTVVGAYTRTATGLRQVACVDDLEGGSVILPTSLQASVTFPTVAGTTYLVQIGGLGADEWGKLRITVR